MIASEDTEWLEADGLGGFASGTTLGLNTRHEGERHALSSQRFAGAAPPTPLPRERCRQVLQRVEAELWTPIGLRSLAPGSRD